MLSKGFDGDSKNINFVLGFTFFSINYAEIFSNNVYYKVFFFFQKYYIYYIVPP